MCEAELLAQLTMAATWAVIWGFGLPWLATHVFRPLEEGKVMLDQVLYIIRKTYGSLFEKLPREDLFQFHCYMKAVAVQHLLGGIMCIPSVFFPSLLGPKWNTILCCQAGLCELGFDLSDTVKTIYKKFYGTDLERKTPWSSFAFMLIHHSLTILCVIPMNLWYRDDWYYHEMIFNLQGAGMFMGEIQGFCREQDQTTQRGRNMLYWATIPSTILWFYTRLWRFSIGAYQMVIYTVADAGIPMRTGATIGLSFMMTFNLFFTVMVCKMFKHNVLNSGKRKADPELVEINRKAYARFAARAKAKTAVALYKPLSLRPVIARRRSSKAA